MQVRDIVPKSHAIAKNIEPEYVPRRFFVPKKIFYLVICISLIIGLFWYNARADFVVFYPSSCLGEWENPDRAEGRMDASGSGNEEEYAAIAKNAHAEIFCGGFEGEIPQDARPKKFSLKFSWALIDTASSGSTQDSFATHEASSFATSTESTTEETFLQEEDAQEQATSSPDILNEDRVEVTPALDNNPDSAQNTSSVDGDTQSSIQETSSLEQAMPDNLLQEGQSSASSPSVLHESTSVDSESLQDDASSQNGPTSFFRYLIPEVWAEGVASSSDAVEGSATTTEVLTVETKESDDTLKVYYTLDGIQWLTLGEIPKEHLQDMEFSLPLEAWDDLSKIQIKVRNAGAWGDHAIVALDGMRVEVEYEEKNEDPYPQPNFKKDVILQEDFEDGARVIKINRQGLLFDEKYIWFSYDQKATTTKDMGWSFVAASHEIDGNSPIDLHEGYIFWIGEGKKTLRSFNIKSGAYNSTSINPDEVTASLVFEASASEMWQAEFNFSLNTFSYRYIGHNNVSHAEERVE